MVKRVFAVIGIVLGSVVAVLGVIVGVMAAMGKFKEPVVYPETLVFEQTNLVINANDVNSLLTTEDGKVIHSFELTGEADSEYPVNRTSCYLSFVQGKDIITLCKKDGTPLTASNGNKYKINCNAPIYYFVNTTTSNGNTYSKVGTVIMEATDVRGSVSSNQIAISIDSKIETIYINTEIEGTNGVLSNTTPTVEENNHAIQNVKLNIGGQVFFNYLVSPQNTLKPIDDLPAKDIELYYNDTTAGEHYLITEELLNSSNVSETAQKIQQFLKYDSETGISFTTLTPGNYEFKIAYFPTYYDKEKFELDFQNNMPQGYHRVQEMEYTILTIEVSNTSVEDIYLSNGVNLNLYLNNNYVTLSASDVVNDANNNNLGLTYNPSNQQTALRYNEAMFIGNNNMNFLETFSIVAKKSEDVSYTFNNSTEITATSENQFNIKSSDGTTFTLSSSVSGKVLNFGYENVDRILITNITDGTNDYVARGMLVVEIVSDNDNKTYTLKAISAGTYLDFYIQDETISTYTKWQNYSVEQYKATELTGRSKTWNILAKAQQENLVLGVLVVNNDGKFCFESVSTSINEQVLNVENIQYLNNREHDLTICYDSSSYNAVISSQTGGELSASNIFTIPDTVTYKGGVLLTPQSTNYSIDVVDNITFTDSTGTYVLVGYTLDDGTFVNNVRVNKNATQKTTTLYVAQIKTEYQQTVEEYISNIIAQDGTSIEIISRFKPEITITVKYDISNLLDTTTEMFNENLITIAYEGKQNDSDSVIKYVENTSGTITIKMDEAVNDADIATLFNNLYSLLGSDFSALFTSNSGNLTFGEAVVDEGVISLPINVGSSLSNIAKVQIVFSYNNISIKLKPIEILTTVPSKILYSYTHTPTEGEEQVTTSVDLSLSTKDALASSNKFSVIVDYNVDEAEYSYNWYFNDIAINSFELLKDGPFLYDESYKKGEFSYSILNTSGVENSDIIALDASFNITFNQVGTCVLKVMGGGAEGFIVVEVKAISEKQGDTLVKGFNFTLPNDTEETGSSYALTGGVYTYVYQNEGTQATKNLDDKIELVNITVSGYTHTCLFNAEQNYVYYIDTNNNNQEVKLLNASNETGTWKFTRVSDQTSSISFRITLKTLTDGEKSFILSFSPTLSINQNISSGWSNLTLYQNTTVMLFESADTSSSLQSSNAVFKIVTGDSDNTVSIGLYTKYDSENNSYDGGVEFDKDGEENQTNLKTFDTCGSYYIVFTLDGSVIKQAVLTVIPNILINVSKTNFVADNTSQEFFQAYSYKTDVVFGEKIGAYPTFTSSNFANNVTEVTDTTNFTLSEAENISLATGADSELKGILLSVMPKANTTIASTKSIDLTIKYNGTSLTHTNLYKDGIQQSKDTVSISIKNPYTLEFSNNTFSVLDNIVDKINPVVKTGDTAVESNISITGLSYGENSETLTIADNVVTTHISDIIEGVTLTFAVTINGVKYSYTLEDAFTLKPYVPLLNNVVYSNSSYNLISYLFNDVKGEITSITATELWENGSQISIAESQYFTALGFDSENTAEAITKPLNVSEAKVVVVFNIKYQSGVTYEYHHELIIKNRDQYVVTYPYSDIKIEEDVVLIKYDSATSGADKTAFATLHAGDNYEPVILGQTIDLANLWYNLNRVTISDKGTSAGTPVIDKVEIYAVLNYDPLSVYLYDHEQITISGTKITFGTDTTVGPRTLGYIQFKFTTTNGNVGYYNVRLYNQKGSLTYNNYFNNISINSNQNFEANKEWTFTISSDSNSNYKIFGKALDIANTFKMGEFDSTKVSMYLLDVNSPADIKKADDGNITVGDESLGFTYYQNITDLSIPELTNYATLKVALIYTSGTTQFCFGTITVAIQPTTSEIYTASAYSANTSSTWVANKYYKSTDGTFTLLSEKPTDWDTNYTNYYAFILENETAGLKTGFYKIELPNSTNEFASPFANTSGSEFMSDVDKNIVNFEENSSTLNFEMGVQEDYTFSVKYTIETTSGNMYLIVEYTYLKTVLETTLEMATVGEFVSDNDTEEYTGFNNTLSLSDYITYDNYSKQLQIEINGEATDSFTLNATNVLKDWKLSNGATISFTSASSDNKNFTFELINAQYTVDIIIRYVGCKNSDGTTPSKTIKVTVLPGIYVQNPSSGVTSTLIENSYTSVNGSELKFGSETGSNYEVFSANSADSSAFKVYFYKHTSSTTTLTESSTEDSPSNSSTMEIVATYAKPNDGVYYVNGDTNTDDPISIKINNTDNNTIYFPHMATTGASADLSISFNFGTYGATTSYQMGGITQGGLVLTVKLAQTYKGINLNYLVNGVNHENVVSGEWKDGDSSEDIFTMLTKNISNTAIGGHNSRISLVDLDGNALNTYNEESTAINFAEMGFRASSNPNYLTFSAPNNSSITSNVLSFNEISTSQDVYMGITNHAGIDVQYKFYLLASTYTSIDGWTLNTENTNISAFDSNSVSYLVGDNNGTLAENKLASLFDGNNSYFAITSSSYEVTYYDETSTKRLYSNSAAGFSAGAENTIGSYGTFKLWQGEDKNVYISFAKGNLDFTKIKLTLSIHGDTSYICEDFTIYLYNYTETLDESAVLATDVVDLNNTISYTNCETKEKVTNLSYKLVSVNGKEITLSDNGNYSNTYFDYNSATNVITTKHVPSVAILTLKFNVYEDSQIVKTLDYKLTINRSIEFVVDGTALGTNESFTSTYYLNNATATYGNFPLSQSYVYNANATNPLAVRAFLKQYLTDDLTGKTGVDLSQISITVINDYNNNKVVTIDSSTKTIKFNKDITTAEGKPIHLKISHTTINGEYSVDWYINIVGLETITYSSGDLNTILKNGGTGFASGLTLNLISKDIDKLQTNLLISPELGDYKDLELTAKVSYVISDYEESITAENLFANQTNIPTVTRTFTTTLPTTLPIVAERSEAEYQLVTYKIEISYMGQAQGTYYVSYKVYNGNSLTSTLTENKINVDSDSVMNGSNLRIFSFAETYTYTNENNETITLTLRPIGSTQIDEETGARQGFEMKLYIGNNVYSYVENTGVWTLDSTDSTIATADESTDTSSSSDNAIKIVLENGKYNYYSGTYENGEFTQNSTNAIELTRTTSEGNSLFTGFSDIEYFTTYLNGLSNVTLEPSSGCLEPSKFIEFNLSADKTGVYIDLYEFKKSLFNNEMITNIALENTSGEPIITIKNVTFTTSNAISAKSSKTLSDIFTTSQITSANSSFLKESIIAIFKDGEFDEDNAKNWVNSATTINKVTLAKVDGFALISGDSMLGTYQLYTITYEAGSEEGGLYKLTKTFYVMGSSTGNITLVDYVNNSFYSNQFNVEFDYNQVNQTIDCSNYFATYSMVADTITRTPITGTIAEKSESVDSTIESKIISITSKDLITYKKNNKSLSEAINTYTFNIDDDSLTFNVAWNLPYVVADVTFEVPYEEQTIGDTTYLVLDLSGKFTLYGNGTSENNSYSLNLNVNEVVIEGESSQGSTYVFDPANSINQLRMPTSKLIEDKTITYSAEWDHDNNSATNPITFTFTVTWKANSTTTE